MKQILFLVFFAVAFLVSGCNTNYNNTINPVIGDVSFVKKFGFKPDASTDNDLRIRTHLEYVEDLLRNRDVSDLSEELKSKRTYLLDRLREYAAAGVFPKNYDFAEDRKPCFIDKNNTICAVGYLVEKSAGRAVAEQINQKHKYDQILEMQDTNVDNWIASSGLSEEECAMIQPQYGPGVVATHTTVKPGYAIASSILIGANVSLNTLNIIGLSKNSGGKAAPVLGLLAGAGQITLGAISFKDKDVNSYLNEYGTTGRRTLSMINIGLGTTTTILSICNLAAQKKAVSKRTSWNVYGFPDNGRTGVGLSFSRKI